MVQWPWDPGGLFGDSSQQPTTAPKTYAAPTPPAAGASAEQQAQYLVDLYLAWLAAGKPGTPPDDKGNFTPLGPDGQPSQAIPSEAEFDAARQFLSSKASTTGATTISAPSTDQYIVMSDGTVRQNPNYVPRQPAPGKTQAEIDQEAQDAHAAAVASLGKATAGTTIAASSNDQYIIQVQPDGTIKQTPNPNYVPPKPPASTAIAGGSANDKFIIRQNPDGTFSQVPNPNYVAPKPTQIGTNTTDQFIVQQNADGTTTNIPNPNYVAPKPSLVGGGGPTDKYIVTVNNDGSTSQIDNPNYVNPDKIQQALQSHADAQAKIDQMVADGTLTQDQAAQAKQELQGMLDAALQGSTPEQLAKDQADRQYQQAQIDNARRTQDLAQANDQAAVLEKQAQAGQDALQFGAKLGVAPPMELVQMAYGPLYAAQSLIKNAVQSGMAPPSAIPTPRAPSPMIDQSTVQAPMPAPSAPTPTPTPTVDMSDVPTPFTQSGIPEGSNRMAPVPAY